MGIGQVTLALAIIAFLIWLTYLVNANRLRRRSAEATPANLSPFLTDDELETKRLNVVLVAALAGSALLAIVLPWYYFNESGRQAHAAEVFEEIAVERGEHWYEEFGCGNCHGPDGGGGGAAYVEKRSGLATVWAAPSLDDILYRYTEDEVRYWLIWGRQNSPMPAWGVEGGGPLNGQQIDELIAYLDHIQIPQMEAVGRTQGRVDQELRRLEGAEDAVTTVLEEQKALIESIEAAPAQFDALSNVPTRLIGILADPDSCTVIAASMVGRPCERPGSDSDRDGLSDLTEVALNELIAEVVDAAPTSAATGVLAAAEFDPNNAFTTSSGSTAVPDLSLAESIVSSTDSIVRDLRLLSQNGESLLAAADKGVAFLEEALATRPWNIDMEAIAAAEFDGDVEAAWRGYALYNVYCAPCHTAGYSAGIAFTQAPGSGALGPSLEDGRSMVQFPDEDDHLDFIIRGSENGQGYGVNGIGRGWMPGFGALLTQADLESIVNFERALE